MYEKYKMKYQQIFTDNLENDNRAGRYKKKEMDILGKDKEAEGMAKKRSAQAEWRTNHSKCPRLRTPHKWF